MFISLMIAVSFIPLYSICSHAAEPISIIYLKTSVSDVGEKIYVNLLLDSPDKPVCGININLSYDPAQLRIASTEEEIINGSELQGANSYYFKEVNLNYNINNTSCIKFCALTTSPGLSKGTVATICFDVLTDINIDSLNLGLSLCEVLDANVSNMEYYTQGTVVITKGDVAAPAAPVVESKSDKSVTLVAKEGYEYSMDGETWQPSNKFENLDPAKEYTFYQRIAETETTNASAISEVLKVTTLKSDVAAPAAPVVESKTDKTVTLVATAGYEYSMDGTTWVNTNKFENLDPAKEYTFYQRIAETATTNASLASIAVTVKTIKIGDVNEDGVIKLEDAMKTFQHVAGKITLEGDSALAADVNGDKLIKLDDAMKIFQVVAGKRTSEEWI